MLLPAIFIALLTTISANPILNYRVIQDACQDQTGGACNHPGAATCCGMKVNICGHSGYIQSGTCIAGTRCVPVSDFQRPCIPV
jgi:hypothetical protein